MQSLLYRPEGITALQRAFGRHQYAFFCSCESYTSLQGFGIPARYEGGKHSLVFARRYTQEIDDRYPVLKRLPKPSIVGRIRILPHKCIIDRLIALEDLTMHLALIVIPDLPARSRVDSLDG